MSGGRCQGNMMVRLGLLMIFPALCHGLESCCDATQGVTRCYTPLGGTMWCLLVSDANELEVEFKQSKYETGDNILKSKRQNVTFNGTWKDRSHFYVNNGILKITGTVQTDYGDYNLTVHDTNGTCVKYQKIQLLVGGGLSWLVVISSLAAVVLMAVLGYYFLRRRRQQPAPDTVENQDIAYASIDVSKIAERHRKEKEEVQYDEDNVRVEPEEVQYGQIQVQERSGRKIDKPNAEETIYTGIQLGH
ncbi:uncharacterized protein LOC134032453 [Osmerus eperlanus]|uniref:uncharacterized protein LOC134032453 n=1 Tax=Osmerus eperlanus TaxID=29151 RepID=UPI002E0F09C3